MALSPPGGQDVLAALQAALQQASPNLRGAGAQGLISPAYGDQIAQAGQGWHAGAANPDVQAALQNAGQAMYSGPIGNQSAASAPPENAPRGNTATGPGFGWGGHQWGPNDFVAFSNWLVNHGVDVASWARAHPAAFASFNLDPNIRHFILTRPAPRAKGGMGHK